jgi:MATE family multidrug resistance protein
MILSIFLAWLLMVLPTYISCIIYRKNIFWAWSFASFYIIVLGLVFLLRFLSGKWKTMRVIEEKIIPLTPVLPELPTLETEL